MALSVGRRLVDASRNALLVPDTAALSTLGHAVRPRSPRTMVMSGRLCDTVQSCSKIFHLRREQGRKQEDTPFYILDSVFLVAPCQSLLPPKLYPFDQSLINGCNYRAPRGYLWYLFVFRGEQLVLGGFFHPFLKVAQTRDIPSAISFGHVICMFRFRYCGAAVSLMDMLFSCFRKRLCTLFESDTN